MLPLKKQFQPLLSSISQVIEPQNLIINKPTWRQGYLKKEKAFNSDWKNKTFCFFYLPYEKLTCQIYSQKGDKLEEKIDLVVAKLSKKSRQVDNRICFGVVSPNQQKYLIALKSNRECMNIFNNLTSAKKILKLSIFKSESKKEQNKLTQSQSDKVREQLKKLSTKSQDQLENSSSEQKFRLKYMKESLLKPYILIQNFKGYQLIKQFTNGKLQTNKDKSVKLTMNISSLESSRILLDYFWQLDVWNNKVKKFNKIAKIQTGVYRFYLQFHRQGCFSSNKSCQVLLSLFEIEKQCYLSLSSITPRPQYISSQKWVNLNVSALIKTRESNSKEKELLVSLESSNHGHLMSQFGVQLLNFNEFVKCKVEGEQRHLQIKVVE